MTEVKWGILFTALFLCLCLGLECQLAYTQRFLLTEQNLNVQLDTCLEDTLENISYEETEMGLRFSSVTEVGKVLEEKLLQAFRFQEITSQALEERVVFVFLYERDGFYYTTSLETNKWIWQSYVEEEQEKHVIQMEEIMEKESGLQFSFPEIEKEAYGETLKGTGALMVYDGRKKSFLGEKYDSFLLSGAKSVGGNSDL